VVLVQPRPLPFLFFRHEILVSLAQHHFDFAPPIFVQPYTSYLNFRRQIFQNCFARRMKLKCGSDQPNQRRPGIDFDSFEIAAALKVSRSLMGANSQPIIHRLNRHLNILRGFQFDHHEPALARNSKKIQNPAISRRKRGNLGNRNA